MENTTKESAAAKVSEEKRFLLGDEAVALAALHEGLSAAYGYPGTPSTEIMEFLQSPLCQSESGAAVPARWCSNEKTALEGALGISFAGKRSLVTMKHVGLNVAADPFVNSALLGINGGLVIAAADDPGMHSSQDEQDSRFYAAFALVPCLEPRSVQECYDFTREAFLLSERFHVPVVLRLVTRIAHARAGVTLSTAHKQNALRKAESRAEWSLLPANARKNYTALLETQKPLLDWSTNHSANRYEEGEGGIVILTAGLGGNYYEENRADFIKAHGGKSPRRLHICASPLPVDKIRQLCKGAREVLVIEEGQPYIEEKLRGILPAPLIIHGKCDGTLPPSGELDADIVRKALGLPPLAAAKSGNFPLPARPPQLCKGCPHRDSYEVVKAFTQKHDASQWTVNSDIGCYALGALPPLSVPESIVCMGASIGMARGAAEAGIPYAIAVLGDSTFLHSGIPALIDALSYNAAMTIVILDNSTVAMTGCQEPIAGGEAIEKLVLGCGVPREHLVVLEALPQQKEQNLAAFTKEMDYRGLSVVIFRRECLQRKKKA